MAPKIGETDTLQVALPNVNRTEQTPTMRTGYIVPVGKKPEEAVHNILNSDNTAQKYLDQLKKQRSKTPRPTQIIPFIRTITPEEIERRQQLEKFIKQGDFEKLIKQFQK